MQSFLIFSSLLNLIVANGEPNYQKNRPGWECKKNVECLKEDRKELKRIEITVSDPQNIKLCQAHCEEYGPECAMVDIESIGKHARAMMAKTCVLYRWQDANNWGIKDHNRGGCIANHNWMACIHSGKKDSVGAPVEAAPKSVKAQQSALENCDPVMNSVAVEKKPSPLPGWECKKNKKCLKSDRKELKRIDMMICDTRAMEWCQAQCEEYGPECAMVDIESWAEKWETSMTSCTLYKWQDANNWGIKDPKEGGCEKDKHWMACIHNGHALII